jgi:hypothetical protein
VPDPTPPPPVDPFGVTVADVAAFVPEASILDTLGEGQRGVTTAQVVDWLTGLSARVESAVDGWTSLPEDKQTLIAAEARDLIANGAASYLEAARHPERASKADTSYAQVLWDRWLTGLGALAAHVSEWLDEDPTTTHGKPAYSFPAATIRDATRW